MKAKDYAKGFLTELKDIGVESMGDINKENREEINTISLRMLNEFLKEFWNMLSGRNIGTAHSLVAAFKEFQQKWESLCDKAQFDDLEFFRKEGMFDAMKHRFPEIWAMYQHALSFEKNKP